MVMVRGASGPRRASHRPARIHPRRRRKIPAIPKPHIIRPVWPPLPQPPLLAPESVTGWGSGPTTGGALLTVIEKACCAAVPVPLFTVKVPEVVPGVVGVPVITPVLASSVRPAGKVPALIDHVSGLLPVALLVCVYATPTVPLPGTRLVMVGAIKTGGTETGAAAYKPTR